MKGVIWPSDFGSFITLVFEFIGLRYFEPQTFCVFENMDRQDCELSLDTILLVYLGLD